jgi:hypothetical protein
VNDCQNDECGREYVVNNSDAEFPSVYCSAKCQRAADAESMGTGGDPTSETPTDKIRDLRDAQGLDGTWNASEYMRGLYNGLELALSVLEAERKPQLRDAPND